MRSTWSAAPVRVRHHSRDAFDRDDGDGLQFGSGVISVVLASRSRSAALTLPPCATRPLPFSTSCEFPFATLAGSTSRAAHAAASQTSGNWLCSATALSQFACTPAESLTSTNPSALDHPNPTTATPLLLALSRSAPAHVDTGDAIGTKERELHQPTPCHRDVGYPCGTPTRTPFAYIDGPAWHYRFTSLSLLHTNSESARPPSKLDFPRIDKAFRSTD